jgi:signal transduction histidine kinase
MRCRLDFPMPIPNWQLTAEIRHNLFLAFKEALNNAAKYSHGTAVTIELKLQPTGFLLIVSDDGRGLAGSAESTPTAIGARLLGGDGLDNLRRRMARLGGECRLQSEPGRGTRVELSVPLPPTITKEVS